MREAMMDKREQAYREYIKRRTGRTRPRGTFSSRPNKPSQMFEMHELLPCCEGVKNLYAHSMTAKHVAHLFGIDPEGFSVYCNVRQQAETRAQRRQAHA